MSIIHTIGHSTRSLDDFLALLRAHDITHVVDVRRFPGSRRHPHVARDSLAVWLPENGIDYRWEQRLGGFRKLPADSPDVALRNDSFRAYAAHMRTGPFTAAVDEVLAEAATRTTAVMCSETVWWRCHRRLIADFVTLTRDVEVGHLMPGCRQEPHRLTDGVRRGADGWLVYDAGAQPLPSSG
jgi:uncharacterized protein (DUF488 family)